MPYGYELSSELNSGEGFKSAHAEMHHFGVPIGKNEIWSIWRANPVIFVFIGQWWVQMEGFSCKVPRQPLVYL